MFFPYRKYPYMSFLNFSPIQVDDYSKRKAMKVEDVERWLAPILGYDAEEEV